MERVSFKRPRGGDAQDGIGQKRAKSGDAGGDGKKLSFGERMLLKQGWGGRGTGIGQADNIGIAVPIEVVTRPSKLGLGSIAEKSKTQKQHEREKAKKEGKEYLDSSEEERAERRKTRKGAIGSKSGSGASTPGRKKQKFSVADIESEGLKIPATLKDLVDLRGPQMRITDTSNLRLGLHVPAESEANKLAKNAERDLSAYADAYHDLSEEKQTIEVQEEQLLRDFKRLELEIDTAKLKLDTATKLSECQTLDDVLDTLESMPSGYRDDDIVIAAVHPLLCRALSTNDLLELITPLTRIHNIIQHSKDVLVLRQGEADVPNFRKARSTSPYESMAQLLILPKLREAILAWAPQVPYEMCALVKSIEPLLPRYIVRDVNNQILAKLTRELHDWSPRLALKKRKQLPHTWVIPLLEVLPENCTSGILADVKRKVRQMIEMWPISSGPFPGLNLWKSILPDFDRLLLHSLVPRLSSHLKQEFSVDPTDQDLSALTHVMSWFPLLPNTTSSAILIDGFFPPLLTILHQWLEGEPNFEEVGQFYLWWKSQVVPQELNELPAQAAKWNEGLEMINRAIDGNLEAFSEEMEQSAPEPTQAVDAPSKEAPRPKEVEEATFKDIVEDWCESADLLLIPLREAHPTTGLPLFRITANAVGRGGVVVYMKGDVLYAAEKKDKSVWKPIGLGPELVDKAEGK
jgi:tuftelin-interacting protein 11